MEIAQINREYYWKIRDLVSRYMPFFKKERESV
jgi:hypothetical protein